MARAVIAVMLALVAAAPAARADTDVTAQTIETYLARGQKLFDSQDYAAAIQTLSPVTRDARATRAQRLRALELIALARVHHAATPAAARATFERILDIDPGYQLRDTSGSPKIRAFFDDAEEAARSRATTRTPAPTSSTRRRPPATAGTPLEIEVRVTRGNVFDLVLATRRRGELAYQIARDGAARRRALARARARRAVGAKPYVLEYYLEARDAGGAAIARVASPDEPLEIALAPGGDAGAGKRPWYGRWYVIAGAAVARGERDGDRRRERARTRAGIASTRLDHGFSMKLERFGAN